MIRIDPARPPVDCDTLRCPGCRQTLTAIIGCGQGLPAYHRRWATRDGVRIDNKGHSRGKDRCTYAATPSPPWCSSHRRRPSTHERQAARRVGGAGLALLPRREAACRSADAELPWTHALAFTGEQETDDRIPAGALGLLALKLVGSPEAAAGELVGAGLWVEHLSAGGSPVPGRGGSRRPSRSPRAGPAAPIGFASGERDAAV